MFGDFLLPGNTQGQAPRFDGSNARSFSPAVRKSSWNDLADLYQVETRVLIQAVKRNIGRFAADFMFQLSTNELERWRSQFVMSKAKRSLAGPGIGRALRGSVDGSSC